MYLLNDAVSSSDYTASNGRIIGEKKKENNAQWSGGGVVVLLQYLSEGNEENYENSR